MQYLKIKTSTTLADLSDRVGSRNVPYVLAQNNLTRTPRIGAAFKKLCDDIVEAAYEKRAAQYASARAARSSVWRSNDEPLVDWQRRYSILNTMTEDSDVFELACSLNDEGWVVLSELGTFPSMLKIPEDITLADATDIIGDGMPVEAMIYDKASQQLTTEPHTIDTSIFTDYNAGTGSLAIDGISSTSAALSITAWSDPFQWFDLPWGQVSLYSSIADATVDFPVYPQEVSDSRKANYTTMPDLLYQYEPWQIYQSSGPRENTYEFDFHRDMWTGDHRDGLANQLIRFCEANCYPEYNGSAVNTATVTLYMGGKELITGVVTNVDTSWDGPIGLDGWYLHCRLSLTIIEVSKTALSYSTMMNKEIIG